MSALLHVTRAANDTARPPAVRLRIRGASFHLEARRTGSHSWTVCGLQLALSQVDDANGANAAVPSCKACIRRAGQ